MKTTDERSWAEERLADQEFRRGYNKEVLVISFTEQLLAIMKKKRITRSELARRTGKSAPYITQFFRGANYTIESLVLFAHAVGMDVAVSLVERKAE